MPKADEGGASEEDAARPSATLTRHAARGGLSRQRERRLMRPNVLLRRARTRTGALPAIQRHARAAAVVVADFQAIAVQLGDRGDHRQAEAITGAFAVAVALWSAARRSEKFSLRSSGTFGLG